ncbi:isochorismate synthase [Synechococcus sp. A15-24]|uniref:isochorismate synthase n=1 Tax=Synechococcus sp. A15-24 TaxID=1050635 RepID=UPI00164455C4|nr:isochorismate synthase [Synechococcus sp. A15-24]QNJ30184.1 phylloquinone-specific isochorismate synthase [Synechococcus sp. A15-24]
MSADCSFSSVLEASQQGWTASGGEDTLLSLTLPLDGIDPLQALPVLADQASFQMLMDGAPGLCLAAAGSCQQLELAGARRFELAQRFADLSLSRLVDTRANSPAQARPRVLLRFRFFEQVGEHHHGAMHPPAVEAVLPRWQLTSQGRRGWLRLNGVVNSAAEARELAEQLWLKCEQLQADLPSITSSRSPTQLANGNPDPWKQRYGRAVERGIELVNGGELHKLVLAVRHTIDLDNRFNPLPLLQRLRRQQSGSCRFLWRREADDVFFGASPERLLSLRGGWLRSDALAGTAGKGDDGMQLLRSDKDRREHELVVDTLTNQLRQMGLTPCRRRQPQLARHGQLTHLHTPITAEVQGRSALSLAEQLHPTPAVAGLPRREAMAWLRTLEPFERGCYAAPIGWIDSAGDAELRVAIRCGHARGSHLDLTAGAGLVRGSIAERERQEVELKLAVLADQLELQTSERNRSTV